MSTTKEQVCELYDRIFELENRIKELEKEVDKRSNYVSKEYMKKEFGKKSGFTWYRKSLVRYLLYANPVPKFAQY